MMVSEASITDAPSSSVKASVSAASERTGASSTAAIVMVDVAAAELREPSLITHEMVRADELGFWDVLL